MSEITAALREAADLLEQHPELPAPYINGSDWGLSLDWQMMVKHGNNLSAQKATAAQVVQAIGGDWQKVELGDTFHFRQTHGLLRLDVYVDRPAVCERVVTGTETVTIPAVEAQPERVEEREVVEWRCQPLLAEAVTADV